MPHCSTPAPQLPISPEPGTDLLLTCTLPKFRVLALLNTTGVTRVAYLTSRDADQTDGERQREHA